MSIPFPLGDGDLFMSPVGQLLYKYIINEDRDFSVINYSLPIPVIRQVLEKQKEGKYTDFYNKELIVQATLCNSRGDTTRAKELYQLYGDLNFKNTGSLIKEEIITFIKAAGINQTLSKHFTLPAATKLKVFGTGENCSADFSSWCDYGWIEDSTGRTVWQMQGQPATHAGGAVKNQHVEASIELPAGSYTLKYKSDSGHAYNNWDSLPPEDFFWGIILSK